MGSSSPPLSKIAPTPPESVSIDPVVTISAFCSSRCSSALFHSRNHHAPQDHDLGAGRRREERSGLAGVGGGLHGAGGEWRGARPGTQEAKGPTGGARRHRGLAEGLTGLVVGSVRGSGERHSPEKGSRVVPGHLHRAVPGPGSASPRLRLLKHGCPSLSRPAPPRSPARPVRR